MTNPAVTADVILPRFLAPHDQGRVALSLHNVDGQPGDYSVKLEATGAVALERPVAETRRLAANQRELLTWVGFDGFFNACLLRRPPRYFFNAGDLLGVGVQWLKNFKSTDPALTSRVSYLTRGEAAAWDDFSPASTAARETLRKAAGIEAPSRQFVLTGADGRQVVVSQYFAAEPPPALAAGDGTVLDGALAVRLIHIAPAQIAAATASHVLPIGEVDNVAGTVIAIRADGARAVLHGGDPIFAGDVIESSADGVIGIWDVSFRP